MKKLLADITAGKKPQQTYTIEHGIERIHISVPLEAVNRFESAFRKAGDDKQALLEVVKKFNGKVRV